MAQHLTARSAAGCHADVARSRQGQAARQCKIDESPSKGVTHLALDGSRKHEALVGTRLRAMRWAKAADLGAPSPITR